jgi:sulfoxide reductase heme-binding subunit YedZ
VSTTEPTAKPTARPRPPRSLREQAQKHWLRILTHVLALAPFVLLVWDFATNQLSVNPIQDITFRTGTYALVTLLLSLACTPLNTLFGLRQVLPLRRPLGLYAFFYTTLHFLTFAVLDYGLDAAALQEAIFEKRYALVGFAAFLILLPLAITSTKGWMRRLGKNWKRLHTLVYVALGLAILHYLWLVKSITLEPLLYAAAAGALLLLRVPPISRRLVRLRQQWTRQRRQQPDTAE